MNNDEINDFANAEGETVDPVNPAPKEEVSAETIKLETPEETVVDTVLEETAEKETAEDYTKSILQRDGKVPVDQHIKLRQRAQAAEARAAQLEEQLKSNTRPDAENSETDDELDTLPDDEYLTVGQVKALMAKESAKQAKMAEQIAFEQGIKTSAQITAEKYSDYDDVMSAERSLKLLDVDDITKIKQSKNPAETAYHLSKTKLANLQTILNPKPKGKSDVDESKPKLPTQEAILEDEDYFDDALNT